MTERPVHLLDKIAGAWYIWPFEGERRNGTRVLRTSEALAGPFSTRAQAFNEAVRLALRSTMGD